MFFHSETPVMPRFPVVWLYFVITNGDINVWTQALLQAQVRLQKAQVVNLVAPIVIAAAYAALVAGQQIYNIYNTQKVSEVSDQQARYTQAFYTGANVENSAYFDRYIRAHHLEGRKIRYPYRSGMNFNMSAFYGANSKLNANEYSRQSSYVNGGFNVARGGLAAYGMSGLANRYRGRGNSELYPMYG